MSVLLLLSAGAAFASGEAATDQPTGFSLPTAVDSAAALAPLIADSDPVDVEADTDPAAAEELPHTDLNRAEAEELLEGVFGADEIEASAELFDEIDIEAFRSDNVALVAPSEPGAEPGLLFSTLPLRTADESGEDAPVDLGLEESEGTLEPSNPLVQVQIPTQLAEGISLPEAGVRVELAEGAVDRGASKLGDASAFYPNVATDTDFVVAAAPTGFETYTHLRSPDAPTVQKFDLDVPSGAEVRATAAGGAEVVLPDGTTPLTVSAPAVVDAEGSDVPVTLEVEGDAVILSANPGPDAAFPILVDPIFDIYNFTSSTSQGTQGKPWVGAYSGKQVYYNWGTQKPGMNTGALTGPTTPGSNAWFNVYVPRYFTDAKAGLEPTSYIKSLKLWYMTFNMPFESQPAYERPAYPSMQMGLWANGQFAAYGERLGNQGAWTDLNYVFDLKNPNENTNVKNGGFGIATWATNTVADRYVNVQQASVELTDPDSPELDFLGSVGTSWMNATALGKIPYLASDPGLGIYALKVKQPNAEGGSQVISTSNGGCVGTAQSPCPREAETATRAITYNPQSMAQGENMVEVSAADPLNNLSPSGHTTKIKVDHTAPALSLTGNLTEQATAGTNLRKYGLNYTAKDGDDAAAAALTPWGSAGKGEGQLERPMGVAVATDGSVYTVDRLNNRVVKYDKEGKFALQFGSTGSGDALLSDPRGIDIAPDGTVWVADMGSDSIKAFSPSGTFLRKARFTDSASEPYAIASGPGGVLWVTDIGLKRVVKLSENPLSTLLITTGRSGCPGKCVGTAVIGPTGVATDKFGNVWIADGGLGKVLELDSSGIWKFEFGTSGAGDGQIDGIVGIDVSPAGNIAITERNNGRVQIFKPDGSHLRKFGSAGPGNNQFSEAAGLSFGPDNMLAVADAGNKRVTRWSHADLDPQSGVTEVEVKVDGQSKHSKWQTCGTKNCSLSGSWTLDADDYAGGAHKVEVIAFDAVGISQRKTIDIETHGDHTDPAIALSGTMTQQSSLGTTRPTYKLKAVSTDSGPAAELSSGIASTVITVDGTVVDSSSPGCPAGGCSITREWTLNSNAYSVGAHTVEVKAIDAAGRSATKTLTINIARDITAPQFTSLAAFYTAPSGWLEQKSYPPSVIVTDPSGYGVASVQLKIDGQVVQNVVANPCPDGACARFFGFGQSVDLTAYSGGAHPAELVATDGAGNTRKRTWTMNVVPSGDISKGETIETLEAADDTSGANTVGSSGESEEAELAMGSEVLFEEVEEHTGFVAPDAAAPVFVGTDADEAIEIQIPADRVTEERCPLVEQPLIDEGPAELVPDEVRPEPCPDEAYGEELIERETLTITPVQTSPDATTVGLDPDAAAAVTANVQTNVDQLVRPVYNGTHTFTAIRDAAAPEEFSWRVHLEDDQTLTQLDAQNAVVRWDSGHTAFSISATKAHDAIGTNVPTGISVSGNVLTLYVKHRQPSPVGGTYVYPVTAGAGWQGGFQTYQVVMPPPTEQEQQEEVGEPIENVEYWENEKEGRIKLLSASAPIFAGTAEGGKKKYEYQFRWSECRYAYADKSDVINKPRREQLALYVGACADRTTPMIAGNTVFGWVHMIPGEWIWVNENPRNIHCETWGPKRGAPVNCFARPWKAKGGLTLRGDFRLGPDTIGTFHVAECLTMYTEVFSSKPWIDIHENISSYAGADQFFEPCNWPA